VSVDGVLDELRSANVSANVRQLRPSRMIFSFGGLNRTLSAGSAVRLDVQFTPTVQTSVLLLWDDPATPTSVTVQAEDTITLGIQILGKDRQPSSVFPTNNSDNVAVLVAKVTVLDVFGSHDIRNVTMSVSNSTGFLVVPEAPMIPIAEEPAIGNYVFEQSFTVDAGRYKVSATATDAGKNSYGASSQFVVTAFYPVTVVVSDLDGEPVIGATVSILINSTLVNSGKTDEKGSVDLSAPSSDDVGAFLITMEHDGTSMTLADSIDLHGHDMARLEAPLSHWTILIRDGTVGLPIAGATVRVERGNATIASGQTGPDGSVTLQQIAAGTYTVFVQNALIRYQGTYDHSHDKRTTYVDVPFIYAIPMQTWLAVIAVVLVSSLGVYAVRRGMRKRPQSFRYLKTLLGGPMPAASIMMISGSAGSGKTQILYSIMGERLAENSPAIFVTNAEFPSRVRAALKQLGTDANALERRKRLCFVDCYAGLAGVQSTEEHRVSSPTDLTSLGMQISACFGEVGGKSDVYWDSVTPTVVSGGFERPLDFIRHYGARAKAENSSFFYTVSSSIEPEALAKFEDESDCVVQLELYEAAGATRRRMKIKKARGLSHHQGWVEFAINQHGRIEFILA